MRRTEFDSPHHPLWIITFMENNSKDVKKEAELWLPAAEQRSNWLNVSSMQEQKTLDSLHEIQKACDNIRARCLKEIEHPQDMDLSRRAKEATSSIKSLGDIVKRFQKIIEQMIQKPTKEEE